MQQIQNSGEDQHSEKEKITKVNTLFFLIQKGRNRCTFLATLTFTNDKMDWQSVTVAHIPLEQFAFKKVIT